MPSLRNAEVNFCFPVTRIILVYLYDTTSLNVFPQHILMFLQEFAFAHTLE